MTLLTLTQLLWIILSVANAEVRIMGLFGDHMVLQTPHPELGIHMPYIYGTALINETVTITGSTGFPGPFKLTPTSNNIKQIYGNWSVGINIDTTNSAFPGPYTISIISTDINNTKTGSITLSDVYFGEVILCSGQSNMQKTVAEGDSKESEINIAKQFPNIRLIQIAINNSVTPYQNNTGVYNNTWQIAGTKTPVGSDAVGTFSAVCWMTGRRIAAYIMNTTKDNYTPYIGLIESAIGGTTVHFWAPSYVGHACNISGQLPNTGEAANGEAGQLFNTMINPLSFNGKGLSIRNILWYQGEADSGENDLMTQQAYECELFGLINGWRKEFMIPNLVFINFQLPGHFGVSEYKDNDDGFCCWYAIQVAQNNVFKMINNTGLVTAQDQGQNTLHYKHKTIVSERAYNWSRYLSFNDKTINPEGPRFIMAFKENANDLNVKIKLSNIGEQGIKLIEALNCSTFNNLTVYNWNATNYSCCDWNGINIVRMRLEGIYHYEQQGIKMIGIWNWMPGNVTNIENDIINDVSIVTVEPILPQTGCIGWPNQGDKFLYSQTISIKEIQVSTSSRCAIANSIGTPLSKGGPYNIAFDAYTQLQTTPADILATHQQNFQQINF